MGSCFSGVELKIIARRLFVVWQLQYKAKEEKYMSIVNMMKTIKEIHDKDIVLLKVGSFYIAYGKDAHIIAYLFGYKVKPVDSSNYASCGFPVGSINKIKTTLENRKINYVMIDKKDNYDVEEQSDNKTQNNYDEIYEKAHRYIRLKDRIVGINNYLLDNINQEKIKTVILKIEEIIDESR